MQLTSITPGQVWTDTEGKRIHAHGGSMLFFDDTYYWYGENKERTDPAEEIVWHWGVRCYSSEDLYNWTDLGVIIPPNLDDEKSPLHFSQKMDRPHIVYDGSSKKFVCWVKIIERTGGQTATILSSDNLQGPYEMVSTGLKPNGMYAGDFDLVVDPEDAKGYCYFERVHSELVCADLTSDYLGVTGYYSTHFPHGAPPDVREGPAYFRRKGLHYLITSGTTGKHPNPSEVAVAPSYHGPWRVLGDLHPGDRSRTSYNSQVSSVFKHPHRPDLYIALADRWMFDLPERAGASYYTGGAYEKAATAMRRAFSEEAGASDLADAIDPNIFTANTAKADYVWLPIRFDRDTPHIEWIDEWRIEDF